MFGVSRVLFHRTLNMVMYITPIFGSLNFPTLITDSRFVKVRQLVVLKITLMGLEVQQDIFPLELYLFPKYR